MSVNRRPETRGLFARARGVFLAPTTEWAIIDREPATTGGLMLGYAAILAAIPPVCDFAGRRLFNFGVFAGRDHFPLWISALAAAATYVVSLASVFIVARMINAMASDMGGEKNWISALKLSVYSSTIGWVTGLFGLFPPMAIFGGLCALYGFFPLYVGLPRLMRVSDDHVLGYALAVFVVSLLLFLITRFAIGWFAGMAAMAAMGG